MVVEKNRPSILIRLLGVVILRMVLLPKRRRIVFVERSEVQERCGGCGSQNIYLHRRTETRAFGVGRGSSVCLLSRKRTGRLVLDRADIGDGQPRLAPLGSAPPKICVGEREVWPAHRYRADRCEFRRLPRLVCLPRLQPPLRDPLYSEPGSLSNLPWDWRI